MSSDESVPFAIQESFGQIDQPVASRDFLEPIVNFDLPKSNLFVR